MVSGLMFADDFVGIAETNREGARTHEEMESDSERKQKRDTCM